MPPRCLPETPYFDNDRGAEEKVWTALRAALPDEAVLIHSLALLGEQQGEADLVVVWPGVGTAVIEVKGGQVESRDREWFQGGRRMDRSPLNQANDAKFKLLELLQHWGHGLAGSRIWHLVAFPETDVPNSAGGVEWTRSMVIDSRDIADGRAGSRVASALKEHGTSRPVPGAVEVDEFAWQVAQDLVGLAQEQWLVARHEAEVERYATEQKTLVEGFADWTRLHVVGGAGSGKTWLALELARRKVKDGQRVALMCYSRGLGRFLQRSVAAWSKRPAYTGLFHDLALEWGAQEHADDSDSGYWESRLPRQLAELAAQQPEPERFDAVIVDEAQDFSDEWWPSLLACLRDPEEGGLFVFSDTGQRVFPREGVAPIQQPPFVLSRNLRSTRQIAQLFGSLAGVSADPRGKDGPPVRFVQASAEEVVTCADDAVEALADHEQWEPGQIALLTTHHRHPVQKDLVESVGVDGYWDGFFACDDVFYGHVRGFKGLERPVVVLAVNGLPRDRAREVLYTGLSRARSLLVVVGDREQIRAVGGDGVAKRLEKAKEWDVSGADRRYADYLGDPSERENDGPGWFRTDASEEIE